MRGDELLFGAGLTNSPKSVACFAGVMFRGLDNRAAVSLPDAVARRPVAVPITFAGGEPLMAKRGSRTSRTGR